jgi:tetratricopeptide (TPR) repeat protein
MTICNKLLVLIAVLILGNFACATDDVQAFVDKSLIDFKKIEREADMFFKTASESEDVHERGYYMHAALSRYLQLNEYNIKELKYPVQIARIYDYKKEDVLAKSFFLQVLNINKNHAGANLYMGDFYFNRADYRNALKRYLIAHKNGLQNRYELNYNIAVIYEKVGDLVSARRYYLACAAAKPNSVELKEKIESLNSLDYDRSEYYYIIRGASEN